MVKVYHYIKFTTCLIFSVIALISCSDDLTENSTANKGATNGIEIIVSTENHAMSRAVYEGLHTEFEDGDAIGVYVIDNGSVTVANAKFTLDGGKWTSTASMKYSPDCRYFAYYPYTTAPYSINSSAQTADELFSLFITDTQNKFHYADQSTKKNFNASDLMVSEGKTGAPKTITFRMEHKKVLARITGSATVCSYGDGRSDIIPAIMTFNGNLPYLFEGEYRYLMKPGVDTKIGGMTLKGTSGHYIVEDINVTDYSSIEYECSTDGGKTWRSQQTAPSWLTLTSQREGKYLTFTATTTNERTTDILTDQFKSINEYLLRQAPEVAFYRDLSQYNNDGSYRGTTTTANCYLVHAPGTYSLPMVFGNSITDGERNPSAYIATATGDNIMQNLVDSRDKPISDAYISSNGTPIDKVKLLWQDAPGLISNVTRNGEYLRFTVNRETITEGNAVVAAIDHQGNALWSWHIWVTPETLSDVSAVNTGSHEYKVAPVNIGWVAPSGICKVYEGSRCKVRVHQTDGSVIYFEVRQRDGLEQTVNNRGYCPYYQWGRKDPSFPADASSNTSYPAYDINGNKLSLEVLSIGSSIGFGIQNPLTLIYNLVSTYVTTHNNYWDINQNSTGNVSTATQKTVYDPCPPGHCVPTSNLFYYMGNGGSRSDRSFDSVTNIKTWTFDGNTIPFCFLGARYFQSTDTYVTGLYSWSATAANKESAVNLRGDSRYWRYNTLYRSYGCPIRSVLEE